MSLSLIHIWLVQQGLSIIPKSVHPERIQSNIDILDFELTDTEMKTIATMDEQLRTAGIPEDLAGIDWSLSLIHIFFQ